MASCLGSLHPCVVSAGLLDGLGFPFLRVCFLLGMGTLWIWKSDFGISNEIERYMNYSNDNNVMNLGDDTGAAIGLELVLLVLLSSQINRFQIGFHPII